MSNMRFLRCLIRLSRIWSRMAISPGLPLPVGIRVIGTPQDTHESSSMHWLSCAQGIFYNNRGHRKVISTNI